ncbi:MAG: AAA family ATPase [Alphaproteobacteria bacterium]|nr:AAA family ATPase [Alphaproteobacteria bacterium]
MIIVSATATNSGKTTLCAALIRALVRRGHSIAPIKFGPDYIDPTFHACAANRPSCANLDGWGHSRAQQQSIIRHAFAGDTSPAGTSPAGTSAGDTNPGDTNPGDTSPLPPSLIVAEGVMGLNDGARDGRGSTAEVACTHQASVLLVVNGQQASTTLAIMVAGLVTHNKDVHIAGIILNKMSSERHAAWLTTQFVQWLPQTPVLGWIGFDPSWNVPRRHLGLVLAEEIPTWDATLDVLADKLEQALDLTVIERTLYAATRRVLRGIDETQDAPTSLPVVDSSSLVAQQSPRGHRVPSPPSHRHRSPTIAIAYDAAFRFVYAHTIRQWCELGYHVTWFSPLADEVAPEQADAVFLPGGYPELHAEQLGAAHRFRASLHSHAEKDTLIYGECGGFMVLTQSLTVVEKNKPLQGAEQGTQQAVGDTVRDSSNHTTEYPMLGLLPGRVVMRARPSLGYRRVCLGDATPPLLRDMVYRSGGGTAHEFHYAQYLDLLDSAAVSPLFAEVTDAEGKVLDTSQRKDTGLIPGDPSNGLICGSVCGTFLHHIE